MSPVCTAFGHSPIACGDKGERSQRKHLNGKRMVCLDIPDDYDYMQPELEKLLEAKVARFLR
jgi:predicted protein tyrosine phosphatase